MNRHKFFLTLFYLSVQFINCFSQNLISNPSFEDEYVKSWSDGNQIVNPKNWKSYYSGIYYYDTTINKAVYLQGNWSDNCIVNFLNYSPKAFTGKHSVSFSDGSGEINSKIKTIDGYHDHSFIGTRLSAPLIANNYYLVSVKCFPNLYESDGFGSSVGFALCDAMRTANESGKKRRGNCFVGGKLMDYNNVSIARHTFIEDTVNWTTLSTIIKADGTEKYLCLGIFEDCEKMKFKKSKHQNWPKNRASAAALFLDDVSMIHVPSNDSNLIHFYNYGKANFNHILFDEGQIDFDKSSLPLLNAIAIIVNNKSIKNISITGHTDSTGNQVANKLLSEKRAEEIIKYLQSVINDRKINFNGKGEGAQKPIVANKSVEGRALNRRVEIEIN